ncbi:MAG: hypothetical protein M0006_09580 [Magnetospirillum sp.]|nr:hypothetical protein [Magnetospirillum sp.]
MADTILSQPTAPTPAPADAPAPQPAAPAAETQPPSPAEPPAEYANFALPDGLQLDPALADAFKTLARDLGLPQEGAQKLVDLYAGKAREAAEAPYRQWAETQARWQSEAKTDREYGGADLARNVAVAASAIDRFGGPRLRQALEATGAGNHPEVIRFFYRVGKSIAEDTLVSARSPASVRDPAAILYPSHIKE